MPPLMAFDKGDDEFPAKLTGQVVICSIIAAFGGLMFGYDIGISGGVTSMDDFLEKFFPKVYVRKHRAKEDNYCKYDNQMLQLFTSSLYLAAIVCCFFASKCCKRFGRKITMQLASLFFFIGVILNAAAMNLPMLIIGRLCLGAGVGFGNQAVPLFISEIAPAKYRGGLNILFQMLITIGILCANIVNYVTSKMHPHGWRFSLGGAAVPAIFLGLGSFLIVETPTSLIERGQKDEGKQALRKIRGVHDVEKEYQEILQATELAQQIKQPFRNLMSKSSRPQLICGTILQIFQQFTGINVIMFYAPVLFQTMGFGGKASLLSAIVTGMVNVVSTIVAILGVDKFGRRVLLIEAAVLMLVAQCVTGGILAVHLKATNVIPKNYAYFVVVLICVFVSGFAWSWGPLGWLIPSEIFPLETRTAGFFFAVSMNMICTFIIAQAFLTMLCHMRSGIFFFFAVWIVIMGSFAYFFLPETKGIPIDEMNERAWKKHWFWKRYFDDDSAPGDHRDDKIPVN
uniref:Sugar transport protein 8-like n=1 Tax=Nicotiana tabacum TaxID=4097 RepID=A0A1S3Z294_TOBAC|nr:PREDICTED: sugar transport protein 8-like [Nicotiana tabacum]